LETRFDFETIGEETEQAPALCLVKAGVLYAPALEFEAAVHELISFYWAPASAWTVFGECAIFDK
jgi:hypothetical protein